MGLNECYNHIRGQILAMDPLPPVTHSFSLILQEEKQREVGQGQESLESQMAYSVQSANGGKTKQQPKKDTPQCSHSGFFGHTKDKCFKLHGHPPGHKKNQSANSSPLVHQVGEQSGSSPSEFPMGAQQYHQMIHYLPHQMAQISNFGDTHLNSSNNIGMSFSLSYPKSISKLNTWISDSGATGHICHALPLFHNYSPLCDK